MYLNCKTYFSYRYGVLKAEQLVQLAVEAGAQSLALTNINITSDLWDFLTACNKTGIKAILGVEIRNEDELMYIILARNLDGLQNINYLLTEHALSKEQFPHICPLTENIFVIYPFQKKELCLRDHEFIGIQPTEINKLYGNKIPLHKCVVLQPVTYKDKKGYNLHRLLRAIDKNIVLSKQEPKHIASSTETFVPSSQLYSYYSRYPGIITNTLKLIESCNYDFDFKADKNKKYFTSSEEDDRILLEKLAVEGMYQRFGYKNKEAHQRVFKELGIINKLHFNAYFLITWDIIRYAQSRGFYYVGRGSGANSIVAYCLHITDVNPIELDLYFERFLNPYRTSPPDFDIDFSWKDRDEVIDYIFKRYGKDHVALLGMFSTFKWNASIRELGKVFGLPKSEIDALLADRKASFNEDKIQRHILFYASQMQGFPNHLSIHPGGMLISEKPITSYTALSLPPKGFATTQIDMFVADDISLYKLDILSQRGLGHIKECIRLIRENKNQNVDITRVEEFKKDKAVAAQIRKADTIGCFYIESPAMRQLLKKLRCDDYITLVAASSIIRPGVSQSGMMRQYIYRFHNPDKFEYLHPKMKELLEETYGVMVYQEDVIKVAHHFAGLDMGEADILRRAMSGKYRGQNGFEKIKNQFFSNCKKFGYPDAITSEVWRQIESFGGYSFSKAHSASFAVESYQSLFLKTYYPVEFMVAVINNFGGFYSTELYFVELKKTGAKLHAPCINRSEELTNVRGNDVFMGFIHIQGLESALIEKFLAERLTHGEYTGLIDFIDRVEPGIEQLSLLIRAGAFRFTGKLKKALLWEAHLLQKKIHNAKVHQASSSMPLFHEPVKEFVLPQLEQEPFEDALDQIELFGFPVDDVFHLVKAGAGPYFTAQDFENNIGKTIKVLGYFITAKPVLTVKGDYMYFGTFIDKNCDWIDSVHFPDIAERYTLAGNGFYEIKGKVIEEFGVYSIEVEKMQKLGMMG
ncbi:MAG: DNA polymerase III subunit alpha [Candidatus Dadabacteria bacterium]